MTSCRRIQALTLIAGLMAGVPAWAEWQPHQDIAAAAEAFVTGQMSRNAEVTAVAGGIDNRLRLRRCEGELEAWLPTGRRLEGSSTTIGVRCPGPVQWRVFVPVSLQVMSAVVVAQGPLQRGQVIGPEDIGVETRNTGALRREYFTRPEDLLGMRLRRHVAPGSILQANHVEIQQLVRRGQRLMLLASNGRVEISMAGRALQDGARGQRIRVENLSSGKELEGIVTGEGTVEIRF
ncbi:flagellar basal body P-ring formation chaperone FlgA [Natronospira bacteriovora]|uniref:Flagella basal body P-ring formation protein FlgA n=1 Tax=Natronospira bacteriovora TaxID=3069753 RepID=A0ABU0W3H3_9GAMM|nr:flagellar basal body P-ring formation chaperone FlgA [Natronospira sp. AB-CW4]MDQ2068496.1 flagellar basal body P-ring formation chaperone FlgA [Natronospira sp. AB-CW4]